MAEGLLIGVPTLFADHYALTDEQLAATVEEARQNAAVLDEKLHAEHPCLEIAGKTVLVIDDAWPRAPR